jgi:hypothetical protein
MEQNGVTLTIYNNEVVENLKGIKIKWEVK